jgi:tetratricopeptide (TPR) repeat protein
LLCPAHLHAQTSPAAFEAANKLYYENKFPEAAAAYEKLLASGGATPALYFNLGNARFKSGQLGRAITAYHQAERFTPRDPDVRANLQFARNQAQGPTLSVRLWERWLAKLTLNEWTFLALSPVWLLLLLATALQWRPAWGRSLRGFLGGLGIATVLLCGCLAAAIYETRVVRTAVVISPEAVVRSGPLEESKSAFTVHDGAELRVIDRKDDWLMVTTDPRRIGWLRRDQVLIASK